MRYDFSIMQRAEDRWREDLEAANRHRMLKRLGGGDRPASPVRSLLIRLWQALRGARAGRRVAREGEGSNRGTRAKSSAVITGVIVLLITSGTVRAQAASPAESVRAIAEGVLGPDTVKSVRLADGGHTVLIRWESATYRTGAPLAETREILYGEALLTTGAVLGRLQGIVRIRFSMVQGTRMLATGNNWRGRGLLVRVRRRSGRRDLHLSSTGGDGSGEPRRIKPAGPVAAPPPRTPEGRTKRRPSSRFLGVAPCGLSHRQRQRHVWMFQASNPLSSG